MIYDIQAYCYQRFVRPILFLVDPETIHDRMLSVGKVLGRYRLTKIITGALFDYEHHMLHTTVAGIKFKSPIGLSAGFDKDGDLVEILPYLSFGYSQVGSVTDKAYKGNPKPRLYRLPLSKGIVVYYGLKNIGATKIIKKLKKADIPKDFPVSISIAKTNSSSTKTDTAGIKDYAACLTKCVKAGVGDFYTINISCPNTFGGEPFTTPAKLDKLLTQLVKIETSKPVFVKMPINLSWKDFDALLKIIVKHKLAGVIIGNLNKDHSDKTIKDTIPEHIKGGVSGRPTWDLSNDLIARTYKKYGKRLAIVGVGGIFSADDAYTKIKMGASLVQLITGMIYQGPQLISQINKGIVERLTADGYASLSEAVGADIHGKSNKKRT